MRLDTSFYLASKITEAINVDVSMLDMMEISTYGALMRCPLLTARSVISKIGSLLAPKVMPSEEDFKFELGEHDLIM